VHLRRTLPAALAAALALSGCGTPTAKHPNVFSLKPTKRCLEQQGLHVSQDPKDLGLIMGTAPEGALRTTLRDGKGVLIGFGDTDADAAAMADAFRQVARTKQERARLKSLLEPRGNVLVQWIDEPRQADIDLIHSCLES
jgi:hypothetical protein